MFKKFPKLNQITILFSLTVSNVHVWIDFVAIIKID